MDLDFWEAALILTLLFIACCVMYFWCKSKCWTGRSAPEYDLDDSVETNQRGQSVYAITSVLMNENNQTPIQNYNSTYTNSEFISETHPPSYEDAVKRVHVA